MTGSSLLTKSMQRGFANNPQQRASVMKDVEDVFDPNIPFSKKPNAKYGPAVFHAIMMGAAALGASIFGYTAAVRRWTTASCMLARGHRESPCGEWISNICLRVDPCGMAKSLEKVMSANLERLQSLRLLSGKRIDIAIDMHLIRRWDRKHGAELVRSKSKGKTGSFERYIAAQCINPGIQMALALLHMPALEDTACYVRKTISMCQRTGAKIGTVMLDREFFSTDVIRVSGNMGAGYLIPRINTANVASRWGVFQGRASCGICVPYSKIQERLRRVCNVRNEAQEEEQERVLCDKTRREIHCVCHKQVGHRSQMLLQEMDDRDRF